MKLPQLHVGFGTQCGPARFFPVWVDAPAAKGLVTGADAQLGVNELPTPAVTRLSVTNHGKDAALLTEGALLEGGQQHRINARTTLIGAGETTEIEVLCVEEGRWNGNALHRHSSRRAPFQIQAGLHGAGADRQGEIWRRVKRYEDIRPRSATSSLVDHLDLPQQDGALLPNLLDGQRGVIVGFDGQVLSLELFGSDNLFRPHYRALMESMGLDMMLFKNPAGRRTTAPVTAQAARDFVVSIASTGFRPVDHGELRSGAGTITARRLEGLRPGLSSRGASIGGTDGAEPRIVHLSSWNTRHSVFA